MRDTRLVRTATAQERPCVDDEGPPAHCSQVRRSETARRAAADENGVINAAVGLDVYDRLVCAVVLIDNLGPLGKRNGLVSNIHGRASCEYFWLLIQKYPGWSLRWHLLRRSEQPCWVLRGGVSRVHRSRRDRRDRRDRRAAPG